MSLYRSVKYSMIVREILFYVLHVLHNMFYIKKFDNNINLQKDTENLNSIYDSIIIS